MAHTSILLNQWSLYVWLEGLDEDSSFLCFPAVCTDFFVQVKTDTAREKETKSIHLNSYEALLYYNVL